ncbi:MAG: tRNA-intron lyase [Desulfurococcales archaeon]|jgi:tRNA-intron endonuclease|uniref:tRNA-splicing endonuclease n=1 Tax=Fervidicoccus fontis TaxID=683846 RepID=A0A7J3SL64_9CREN
MTSNTLPSTKSNPKARGFLLGLKVILPSEDSASKIYIDGYFGKPFGIKKPERKEYREVVELSLIESLYLVEEGKIEVYDAMGKKLSAEELRIEASKKIEGFSYLYDVYKDLRKRGFIVRSGMKFGSDYAVYKLGPGLEHAPYLVHVYRSNYSIDPVEIVRMGRLSHSVKKKFMFAIDKDGRIEYILFKWFKP